MKRIKKFNESLEDSKDEIISMISSGMPAWKIMSNLRGKIDSVGDGVWDISDIEYMPLMLNTWKPTEEQKADHSKKLIDFITKYPNCAIADAYQTEYPILLSEKPTVNVKYIGSGFNHGSNNVIDNCPKRILICGEDD